MNRGKLEINIKKPPLFQTFGERFAESQGLIPFGLGDDLFPVIRVSNVYLSP